MFLDFSVPRNPLRSLPPSKGGAWQVHGGVRVPKAPIPCSSAAWAGAAEGRGDALGRVCGDPSLAGRAPRAPPRGRSAGAEAERAPRAASPQPRVGRARAQPGAAMGGKPLLCPVSAAPPAGMRQPFRGAASDLLPPYPRDPGEKQPSPGRGATEGEGSGGASCDAVCCPRRHVGTDLASPGPAF